mmetsp:Transcript_38492/g.71093  ORF Transcript_38492/g.71093 Transcript_38492/m.71093 type:complete len:218 (-) Transcript_38492:196-849(-)
MELGHVLGHGVGAAVGDGAQRQDARLADPRIGVGERLLKDRKEGREDVGGTEHGRQRVQRRGAALAERPFRVVLVEVVVLAFIVVVVVPVLPLLALGLALGGVKDRRHVLGPIGRVALVQRVLLQELLPPSLRVHHPLYQSGDEPRKHRSDGFSHVGSGLTSSDVLGVSADGGDGRKCEPELARLERHSFVGVRRGVEDEFGDRLEMRLQVFGAEGH